MYLNLIHKNLVVNIIFINKFIKKRVFKRKHIFLEFKS